MLAARGIDVSCETIRCWTIKFGPQIARNLKRKRPAPSPRWHLDEVVCSIGGKRMYLWRAVDDEGEVFDVVVPKRRDNDAALTLLKRLLHNQPMEPQAIITDGLTSYPSALRELKLDHLHQPGLSPAYPHHSCGDLQHPVRPLTPDQPTYPSSLPRRGRSGLGCGRRVDQGGVGRSSTWLG